MLGLAATTPPVPEDHWYQWDNLSLWLQTWAPIIFMALLVFFIWRTMKLMPRTRPQQIKPESSAAIGWDDVAGTLPGGTAVPPRLPPRPHGGTTALRRRLARA